MDNKFKKEEWFKPWFEDEAYLERYEHRDIDEAKKVVKKLISEISFNKNIEFVLDCASGDGRYTNELSKFYKKTVGLDLSNMLLEKSRKLYPELSLVRADARNLPFKNESFSLITSFFTSFGYFTDDQTNYSLLKNWFDLLKLEGIIILDVMNPVYEMTNFRPETFIKTKDYSFKERRKITENNKRIEKTIEVIPNITSITSSIYNSDKLKTYLESVRMFSFNEIDNMIKSIGFNIKKIFGDYKLNSFTESVSPRIIIIGVKI